MDLMSNLIPNLLEKFETESNLIVVEPEPDPKSCDIGARVLGVDESKV